MVCDKCSVIPRFAHLDGVTNVHIKLIQFLGELCERPRNVNIIIIVTVEITFQIWNDGGVLASAVAGRRSM